MWQSFQFTPLREGRPKPPLTQRRKPSKFQFTPLREGRPFPLWKMRSTEAFQFTPLREGRPADVPRLERTAIFQFTPLREGRPHNRLCFRHHPHFNSRPSARGDAFPLWKMRSTEAFQFTPLREGRPRGRKWINCSQPFQFTPLREGRLPPLRPSRPHQRISIHAPPRGATRCALLRWWGRDDFNSRPSARGDAKPSRLSSRTLHFNSRPSARGDGKRYAISANLLFNPYKSAWLNNSATQFVEIILVIFHRIIV